MGTARRDARVPGGPYGGDTDPRHGPHDRIRSPDVHVHRLRARCEPGALRGDERQLLLLLARRQGHGGPGHRRVLRQGQHVLGHEPGERARCLDRARPGPRAPGELDRLLAPEEPYGRERHPPLGEDDLHHLRRARHGPCGGRGRRRLRVLGRGQLWKERAEGSRMDRRGAHRDLLA